MLLYFFVVVVVVAVSVFFLIFFINNIFFNSFILWVFHISHTGKTELWTHSLDAWTLEDWTWFCGSCGSSFVSLEVFSLAQISLVVQTTVIRHSVFFLLFYISSLWNLKIRSYLFSSVFFSALSCSSIYTFYCFLFCSLSLVIHFNSDFPWFIFKSAVWTTGRFESVRVDSERLDSEQLNAWTLDAWTLDPWI